MPSSSASAATFGTAVVTAMQSGGLTGLVLLMALLLILAMVVIIFLQQRMISGLTKQMISMAAANGTALASTASSLTALAEVCRQNSEHLQSIQMTLGRREAMTAAIPLIATPAP